MRIRGCRERSSFSEKQEFLVFESFTGGAVSDPIRLILVELLKPFDDGDENAEASNYPRRKIESN